MILWRQIADCSAEDLELQLQTQPIRAGRFMQEVAISIRCLSFLAGPPWQRLNKLRDVEDVAKDV